MSARRYAGECDHAARRGARVRHGSDARVYAAAAGPSASLRTPSRLFPGSFVALAQAGPSTQTRRFRASPCTCRVSLLTPLRFATLSVSPYAWRIAMRRCCTPRCSWWRPLGKPENSLCDCHIEVQCRHKTKGTRAVPPLPHLLPKCRNGFSAWRLFAGSGLRHCQNYFAV